MRLEGAVQFDGYRRCIRIDEEVASVWVAHRQIELDADEACGVLVGTTSPDRKEMWIEAVTTPKRLDVRWRTGFRLLDPGHQEIVNEMFTNSKGSMIYLGTWHTHPEAKPEPSDIDKSDWQACHRRNWDRPLAFIIVGTEEVRVYVRWGQRFRRLRGGA